MQLQGLMFLLFMMVILPIIILSINHNIFFIVIAIIMFIVSTKNIYLAAFNACRESHEIEDELIEDLEAAADLDIKKFGTGTKVVKDLVIILFFIYCTFYTYSFWLNIMVSAVLLYWFSDLVKNSAGSRSEPSVLEKGTAGNLYALFVNISALVLIIHVSFNKFLRL